MTYINSASLLQETYQLAVEASHQFYRPTMLLLQSQLADVLPPAERIPVLRDICEHHVDYLRAFNLPDSELGNIYLECLSLIHYNEIIARLMQKPSCQALLKDNNKDVALPKLEQFIYLQSLRDMDIAHYVTFVEAYALFCNKHDEHPVLAMPELSFAILQTRNCLGQLYAEDITEFCKHLYIAESVRLHELGLIKDNECMDIHTFDAAFRNRCFDEYIRLRLFSIKEEMDVDNDRLFPPTEQDYMNRLLVEESSAYNRIVGMEQFRGSEAYAREWYDGKPSVIKMSGYFIQYLQHRLTNPAPFASVPGTSATGASPLCSDASRPSSAPTSAFLWPDNYYTATATDEDKHTFEEFLRSFCSKKTKTISADVKNYLKAKAAAGIITRPGQIIDEYNLVKAFGYPYKDKAYYNA